MKQETQDIAAQAARAAPAVIGTWFTNATPDQLMALAVGAVTFVYIIVQCVYLIRKWVREETEWGRKMRRNKDSTQTTSTLS